MTVVRKLVDLMAEAIDGLAAGIRRAIDAGMLAVLWLVVVIVLVAWAWDVG